VEINNTKTAEGVEVLSLQGDVDMHVSPQVRDALLSVFKTNAKGVLIDLSDVPFMDSSGIATLVEGLRWSKNEGRRFILVGLQDTVSHTLKLAKLDSFFEIFPSQEEALGTVS
jgi:anti-sigma B factor antagonist